MTRPHSLEGLNKKQLMDLCRRKAYTANQSADLQLCIGTITAEDVYTAWENCESFCMLCRTNAACTLDHIKPLWEGGDNTTKNIQWLCWECHCRKTRTERSKPIGHRFIPRYWAEKGTQLEIPGIPYTPKKKRPKRPQPKTTQKDPDHA